MQINFYYKYYSCFYTKLTKTKHKLFRVFAMIKGHGKLMTIS